MPRRKLIRLDDVGGVEALGCGALDDGLGMQQNHVEEFHLAADAVADAQVLQQPSEDASVPLTLLNGRRNAEVHVIVLRGELAVVVDNEVARVVLGFEQVDAESAVDHQVIDLRHVTIDHESQIVQHHVVYTVLEVLV